MDEIPAHNMAHTITPPTEVTKTLWGWLFPELPCRRSFLLRCKEGLEHA